MTTSELKRYAEGNVWSDLMGESRGKLETELASVLAWRRACDLRAEAEAVVKAGRKELDKLQKQLPRLEAKCEEMRVVCAQATDRYNARQSRDPTSAHGTQADEAQREAQREAGQAGRAWRNVYDRVQVLDREQEELESVVKRLEAIRKPETPLLEELNIVKA